VKRLLLLGGGHSHVEVLRRFGIRPLRGVELILVSPARFTTYTGMLPGLVAGHYEYRDCHIDLAPLARFAGARFLQTSAQEVDAARRQVRLAGASALDYDVISIDVGAVPATAGIPGATENSLGVKPFEVFLQTWNALTERARNGSLRRLAVVGGGAAGVEMLLAMQYRLARLNGPSPAQFSLVTDTPRILPTHNPRVRAAFHRILSARKIHVHFGSRIARVERGAMVAANGVRIEADTIIWATGAAPPPLLHATPLALDAAGFIAVSPNLQSTSHAEVFAAGDCASMQGFAVPKSGVYAVRQGPPLAGNLRRALAGEPLIAYRPQRRALALISSGDRYAVASYGPLAFEGAWVWRWKDRIDRRFIARYNNLPRARASTPSK